jgi:hypothetical protein
LLLDVDPDPEAVEALEVDLAAADPDDSFDEDDESEDEDESEPDEELDAAASLDALPFPLAAAARLSVR